MVISLHGIRTRGAFQKKGLTRELNDAQFDHLPFDFGLFGALKLLMPSARRRMVDWFRDEYTKEIGNRETLPSLIAHSFGTYVAAEAMRIYPEIRFDRVVFCGSIVRTDFPWSKLVAQEQVTQVLNDCGQRDFWSGIVAWAVADAEESGVTGFLDSADGAVVQRQHSDWGHSDFFYDYNYRNNWIPFLRGMQLGPTGVAGGGANRKFKISVGLITALLFAAGVGIYYSYNRTLQTPQLVKGNVAPAKVEGYVAPAQIVCDDYRFEIGQKTVTADATGNYPLRYHTAVGCPAKSPSYGVQVLVDAAGAEDLATEDADKLILNCCAPTPNVQPVVAGQRVYYTFNLAFRENKTSGYSRRSYLYWPDVENQRLELTQKPPQQ